MNMPPVPHRLRPSHFLKTFCHDQVKLLLERMDSHPEEFIEGNKWEEFMPNCSSFKHFTKVEQYLIRRKYWKIRDQICRQQAYGKILETLINYKEPKYGYTTVGALNPYTTTLNTAMGTATAHISASGNLTTNTLTLGNETLDADTIKHMKEHLKAIRGRV